MGLREPLLWPARQATRHCTAVRQGENTRCPSPVQSRHFGLGDWPPDESEVGSVIVPEVWQTMAATAPALVGPIAVAVDRSRDRKTWAICAAQRTTEGKIHLECTPHQHLSSPADVLDKLVDIVCAWDPVSITIDSRSAAARQDGRVDVWHFVGSGHRSIVRHALLDGLSIMPSGEKCTGVMGAENGCRRVGAAAWATGTPP